MIALLAHLLQPHQQLFDLVLLRLHLQLYLALQVVELLICVEADLVHISQVVDLLETPAENVRVEELFVGRRVQEGAQDRLGVFQKHILSFPQDFLVDRIKDV